jgi:general secretion pathway protein L
MTMSDTLLLRYPTDDPAIECRWLLVDGQAACLSPAAAGSLAEAAQAGEGARVLWVLPGDVVAIARPVLPPKSGKRSAALVPFALEDQLAAELETLHFAVGAQADDGTVETALVDRDTLSAGLAALAAHGLMPTSAYGAAQLLPATPATRVLLVEGHQILVREPDGTAYCADLLEGRTTRESLDPLSADEPCVLYTTPDSFQQRETRGLPDDGLPMGGHYVGGGPQFLEYGPLQKYAEIALNDPPVNLLQGPFAPVSDLSAGWIRWRGAALVLLSCLAVNLVGSGIDLFQSHRAEVKLDAALHAAYAEAMPGVDVSRLPAPRLAVEARLRRVSGGGRSGLITTLDALGSAVAAAPSAQVKSVNFHDGSIEVVLTAADLAALNQIQQAIGPSAHLAGVSTPDAQHAEGRLDITGANP